MQLQQRESYRSFAVAATALLLLLAPSQAGARPDGGEAESSGSSLTLTRVGVGVMLTGLASASVGLGCGISASRKYAEAERPAISQLEAAQLFREAEDAKDRSNHLVLAGLALGLAGGALVLVDVLSPDSSDPSFAVAPTDGGAVAAFGLRW